MTIYSWNMLFRNRELDRAFDFIAACDFDIFCLQEVPGEFIERLKTLNYHLRYQIDVERSMPRLRHIYLVILSKHPFVGEGRIPFPDYWPLLPARGHASLYLMRPFHFSRMYNRGGFYADVRWNGKEVRVFNLHLLLIHPFFRLKEFELVMSKQDASLPTIICGDFNILEKPHITILNWLFGGKISDALFYRRERTHIEKRFVEHSLTNALRGTVTHPLSQSQLDHILVPREFSIKNAEVLKDRMGSDHRPIRVEIA